VGTQTARDAKELVMKARTGSLSLRPSREFLEQLLTELEDWREAVKEELFRELCRLGKTHLYG
jgi:hypothetical protein